MIFGHHFDFLDEPILQKEYNTFFHTVPNTLNTKMIQVVKLDHSTLLNEFSFISDWTEMSGQKAKYYSEKPISKLGIHFSWALEIKDVVTLIWESKKRQIIYLKGKNYTPKRLQFWIFHTFFPLVLELERIYSILHVGSVEIENKPVLFSAFSFGGKSTLTDYFIRQGHVLLSDDSLGIEKRDNRYFAIPSFPFHRPYREPETLGYPVKNFSTKPKPLYAVYLLEKSEPDAVVEICEVKGIEKFKAFHYTLFVDFSFMKKERFDFFTEMAKHVPVYKVKVPWDLNRLHEVYDKIIEQSVS